MFVSYFIKKQYYIINMLKSIAKQYVLPSLVNIGVEKIFQLFASNKLMNIFYHGVVNKDSSHIFARHIQTEQFEQHMKYLHKNFNVISQSEAFEMYKQGIKADKYTLTVSFDDGYLNNLHNALPIIEKYKIKTTFFISGVCTEDENYLMWADIVAFARYFSEESYVIIEDKKFIKQGKFNLVTQDGKYNIADYIKKLSYEERTIVLGQLVDRYKLNDKLKDIPSEWWKLLNSEQLKNLSSSELVTIGSHGFFHYNLANIAHEKAFDEMKKSKEILEDITQTAINSISFPDGSYNEEVKKMARSLGYTELLAVDYRCASDIHEKDILNRWGVPGTTSFETVAFLLNKALLKESF
jgi:peptidoglycan/xylan/chitin deacetylase (PgdA/CDA1 family)